ncbi:MAG: STAS domain-containing protein [Acidimicrobiia bacterium]
MLLHLTTSDHRGWHLVAASGEIDIASAPSLDGALDAAIDAHAGPVAVDLRSVSFMDSSGLRSLLTARRRLAEDGRPLGLVCGPGPVRRVLEVAGVLDRLPVVDEPDELPDE